MRSNNMNSNHFEPPFGSAPAMNPNANINHTSNVNPNNAIDSRSVGQQLAHNYINSQTTKPVEQSTTQHNPNEILNLKLDAIKSTLENLDLRVRKIENMLEKRRPW